MMRAGPWTWLFLHILAECWTAFYFFDEVGATVKLLFQNKWSTVQINRLSDTAKTSMDIKVYKIVL